MRNAIKLTIIIGLVIYASILNGQTKQSNLDQRELIKQFVGKFQNKIGTDTLIIWDCKAFGNGYELAYTFSAKGKTYYDVRDLWGYDEKTETWVVLSIENIENYKIFYQKFISPTEMIVNRAYILGPGEKQESYVMVAV